jgi:hypothetical protein
MPFNGFCPEEHIRLPYFNPSVTVGQEASGVPFAAVVFSDGNLEECLKIHGTEDVDRRAINKLTAVLDCVSEGE